MFDNMERKIETHSLTLMLKQQPCQRSAPYHDGAEVVTDLSDGDQAAGHCEGLCPLGAFGRGMHILSCNKHLPPWCKCENELKDAASGAFHRRDNRNRRNL